MAISERKLHLTGIVFILLLLAAVGAQSVCAGELISSLAVKEEYNDNALFSADGEVDDFITTIAPQLELVHKTERLDTGISGRVDGIIYTENDDLNEIDQHYLGYWRYDVTPRFNFGAEASNTVDSRPDRDIEESGLVLDTTTRRRQQYMVSANATLTQKAGAGLTYTYGKDDFENQEANDFNTHSGNLGLTYNLGTFLRATVGTLNIGLNRSEYATATIDNYSLTIGINRQTSELFSLIVDLGTRFTKSDFEVAQEETERWGAVAQIQWVYHGEVTDYNLSFSHDVNAASGRVGATERTGLRFSVGRRLTEKFKADLSTSYFLNSTDQQEFAADEIDQHTFNFQIQLRYAFSEQVSLETSYAYSLNDDRQADAESRRNLIFLQLLLNHSLLG